MTPNRFKPGQLSASDAAALNEIAAKVDGLSRMTVAAPLAMTKSAGIPMITTATFEVLLGEVTDDDGGDPPVYTVKRKTREGLDPSLTNTVVDYVPETLYDRVLNPLGGDVIPSTVPVWRVGTLVQLVPIADWRGWYWGFEVKGETGFFAKLTATDGTGWNFYRQTLNVGGTALTNDGDEVTGYLARPVPFLITPIKMEPVVDAVVWCIKSKTSPYYEFFPVNYANLVYPGLVSTDTQDINGIKRFQDSVYVNWVSGANTLDGKLFVQGHDDGILEPENTFTASSEDATGVYPHVTVGDFALGGTALYTATYGRPLPVYEIGSNGAQGRFDAYPTGITFTSGIPLSVSSYVATPQVRFYAGQNVSSYTSEFGADTDGELFMSVQMAVYCSTIQKVGGFPPSPPFVTNETPVARLVVPNDLAVNGAVVLNGDIPSPDPATFGIRVSIATREYPGLSGFAGSPYALRYKDWSDVNQVAYFQCGVLLADTGGANTPFGTYMTISNSFTGGCDATGTGESPTDCQDTSITGTAAGTASGTGTDTATATLSSITLPACATLIVHTAWASDGGSPGTDGPTFAGYPLTYLGISKSLGGSGVTGEQWVWAIKFPSEVTGDVVLEVTGGTTGTVALLTATYVAGLVPTVDQSSTDNGANSNPNSGTTGTTTAADEYATGAAFYTDDALGTGTWQNSFTEVQRVSAGGVILAEAYRILSATGTVNATISAFDATPDQWSCVVGTIA